MCVCGGRTASPLSWASCSERRRCRQRNGNPQTPERKSGWCDGMRGGASYVSGGRYSGALSRETLSRDGEALLPRGCSDTALLLHLLLLLRLRLRLLLWWLLALLWLLVAVQVRHVGLVHCSGGTLLERIGSTAQGVTHEPHVLSLPEPSRETPSHKGTVGQGPCPGACRGSLSLHHPVMSQWPAGGES